MVWGLYTVPATSVHERWLLIMGLWYRIRFETLCGETVSKCKLCFRHTVEIHALKSCIISPITVQKCTESYHQCITKCNTSCLHIFFFLMRSKYMRMYLLQCLLLCTLYCNWQWLILTCWMFLERLWNYLHQIFSHCWEFFWLSLDVLYFTHFITLILNNHLCIHGSATYVFANQTTRHSLLIRFLTMQMSSFVALRLMQRIMHH